MGKAAPLDVVFLDFWSPGDSVTDKDSTKKVLTYNCCITSFVAVGFAGDGIDAKSVEILAMECFFTPFGLPRLIIVDADSFFCGSFEELCKSLGVPVYAVSRETHREERN